MKLRFIIGTICFLFTGISYAQKASVKASLDTNSIMIGQQFRLNLKVDQVANLSILWPAIGDSIGKGVEVVESVKTDTAFSENKERVTFNKEYILTSFDSGAYTIPALAFVATTGNVAETLWTNPLFVKVERPAVDTTKDIRDIKGPLEIPFDWREFIPHILIGFAALLLILLTIFIVRRAILRRRVAEANKPVYVAPPIPADEKALTALAQLQEKQLWQRGKNKEYHTELTDIIRWYIKESYDVDAPEMLSDEILQRLRFKEINGEHKQLLKVILELADMVKFAKVQPSEIENTESFEAATRFVKETTEALNLAKKAQEAKKNEKKGGPNEH